MGNIYTQPHRISVDDFDDKFDLNMASATTADGSFRKMLFLTAVSREYVVRRRYFVMSRSTTTSDEGTQELLRTTSLQEAIDFYNRLS